MLEQGGMKEEYYSFSENQDQSGQQNVTTPSIPIESMNDQYIQAEIQTAFKSTNTTPLSKFQVTIPPIEYLEDDFQEFTENKAYSFLLLSFHPYFRERFDKNDIKQVAKSSEWRGQFASFFNIFALIGIYSGSTYLFKTRPIFGLTHNSGFTGMFFRYYLVPKLIGGIVDQYILYPNLQKKTSTLLSKYNFDTEIKSNPLYKKAYEDFKLYHKNLIELNKVKK